MRVLFVQANYHYYLAIDTVIRELYRRGHEIYLITDMRKKRAFTDELITKAQADMPNLVTRPLIKRRFLRAFARDLREILNYAHVLNHESTRLWDVALWERFFKPWLWRIVSTPRARTKLKDLSFQGNLRALEQKIPVNAAIRKEIKRINPDVVLLLPLVNPDALENEYMRAAQTLRIPTIYVMSSWDNTSTKGTFHGYPDYSFVWNKPLADELVNLHGHPRDRIFMTGTPRFSHLFSGLVQEYILPRDEFYQQAGLDKNKPYVLYVGSTFLVNSDIKKSHDEGHIILEVAHALENDPGTWGVNLMVRPHPFNLRYIPSLLTEKRPNVFIFPQNEEIPDTEEKMRRYNSSIYYAKAVIGVNTTAFLEVAALDRPCITIYFDRFIQTQKLPHFHHLEDAGFLETAHGPDEVAAIVRKIIGGMDELAAKRREFAKTFLTPTGSEKLSYEYFADLVEELALKKK
ncbi:MAG: hypothetical protein L6Q49_18820 [Anaerolineales bacterium]|nr:hypothetical protein [Anaerolineales bacterium]